jgi:hypothetical protein
MNPTDAPNPVPPDAGKHVEAPPLPDPRHDLPVPALAARAMDVPFDRVHPRDLGLIEQLRHDVRRLDFTPLTDEQVTQQVARWPSAAASTAIEGNPLQPAEIALTHMFFEERVPTDVRPPIVAQFVTQSVGR